MTDNLLFFDFISNSRYYTYCSFVFCWYFSSIPSNGVPPVACILASVLHFRDDTLHVFRQVIGTVAYLGIGERAVIPQGLQGALADFQLQADILVVEPASRPLHAFQIQMGIPSTLCMNRSIFMANSSNAFLSKHTVSITIRFYVDTSNSYHPEKRSLVVPV